MFNHQTASNTYNPLRYFDDEAAAIRILEMMSGGIIRRPTISLSEVQADFNRILEIGGRPVNRNIVSARRGYRSLRLN